MVDIFHQLEMITFNILAHDGTLYPIWARYKGCTYFNDQCEKMEANDVLDKIRSRILYRLNHMDENALGSGIRIKIQWLLPPQKLSHPKWRYSRVNSFILMEIPPGNKKTPPNF